MLFDLLLTEWHLPAPNLVVSLVGEERPFAMKSWLRDILRKGLVKAAQSTGKALPRLDLPALLPCLSLGGGKHSLVTFPTHPPLVIPRETTGAGHGHVVQVNFKAIARWSVMGRSWSFPESHPLQS